MNEIREIVTKAVIGKGKKLIKQKNEIAEQVDINSILGCWIINHNFTATLDENCVDVVGSYEINIWYSGNNNTETNVLKEVINYNEVIKTRQIVDDIDKECRDVIVRMIQKPTCTNAEINENGVCVEVVIEMLAEIIGETKMIISVFSCDEVKDDFIDDFENEINEDFLNCKCDGE